MSRKTCIVVSKAWQCCLEIFSNTPDSKATEAEVEAFALVPKRKATGSEGPPVQVEDDHLWKQLPWPLPFLWQVKEKLTVENIFSRLLQTVWKPFEVSTQRMSKWFHDIRAYFSFKCCALEWGNAVISTTEKHWGFSFKQHYISCISTLIRLWYPVKILYHTKHVSLPQSRDSCVEELLPFYRNSLTSDVHWFFLVFLWTLHVNWVKWILFIYQGYNLQCATLSLSFKSGETT